MKVKRSVSIVLVVLMVLTMSYTGAAFAADTSTDKGDTPLTVSEPVNTTDVPDVQAPVKASEPVVEAAPQLAPAATLPLSATIEVNAGESINNAIETANVGDTIVIGDGQFNEEVYVTKSVTLISKNGPWNEKSGADSRGTALMKGIIVSSKLANVSIKNLYIVSGQKAAVSLLSEVSNCTIEGNVIVAICDSIGLITTGGQKDSTVINNTFKGANAKILAFIGRQPDAEINYVDPLDDSRNTLAFNPSVNVDFTNNSFFGSADYGLATEAESSSITGNTFTVDARKARLCVAVSGLEISGNTFKTSATFPHRGAQFYDKSGKYVLETVRTSNTFEQAAYDLKAQISIYYYIQDAVDAANYDETVVVGAGVYKEQVEIGRDRYAYLNRTGDVLDCKLTLLSKDSTHGTAPDSASQTYAAKIQWADGDYSLKIVNVNAGVRIDGFQIDGMYGHDIKNCDITHNMFTGKHFGVIFDDSDAITAKTTTFDNNWFTGNVCAGLFVKDSEDLTLNANVFSLNGKDVPCPICEKLGTTCEFLSIHGDGASIIHTTNVKVIGNTFKQNYGDGLEMENVGPSRFNGFNTVISSNRFDNNGNHASKYDRGFFSGMNLFNCDNLDILRNYSITGNTECGIRLDACDNVKVIGHNDKIKDSANVAGVGIKNNSAVGVLFENCGLDIEVSDNIVNENGDGVLFKYDREALPVPTVESMVGIQLNQINKLLIANNLVSKNTKDGVEIDVTVQDLTAKQNTITENAEDGLYVFNAAKALIDDNDILRNGGDGIYFGTGTALIADGKGILNNLIQKNVGGGIAVMSEANADIQKNNILENGAASDNTSGGIYIKGYATVHYNNIVGNVPFGLKLDNNIGALAQGTLASDSRICERPFTFNFWGDASGPIDAYQRTFADYQAGQPLSSGNLLGECNAIIVSDSYKTQSVEMYAPWISQKFELLGVYDENGKTAEPVIPYAVKAGWNFISTPKLLAVDQWSDIKTLGNDLDTDLILGYDSAGKAWKQGSQMTFTPQNAYFLRMKSVDMIPMVIRMHTVNDMQWSVPVTKDLNEGWNLVGKAFDTDPMKVEEVLASAQGPISGWQYVIHPDIDYGYGRTQDDFDYTSATGHDYEYQMFNFAGYWVYMNSDKTIAGDATSYVWDNDIKKINKLFSLTDTILNVRDIINP